MGAFTKVYHLSGNSAETKPVDDSIAANSTYTELDTGNVYSFNRNKGIWVKVKVGSGHAEPPIEGVSIYSIDLTKSEGQVDTYTIRYTNGYTSTFNVTNGDDVIINKYIKPLMADRLYTLDLKHDDKEKFQLYKVLHLDNVNIDEETGIITTEEIPADKFWPRTEDGKFVVADKEKKIELVFNYVGKNKTDNECWEAVAIDQRDEFVRYVGRFYWVDPEDHLTRGYYFKAKKQSLNFKVLNNSIKEVNEALNNEIATARQNEDILTQTIDHVHYQLDTDLVQLKTTLIETTTATREIADNANTLATNASTQVAGLTNVVSEIPAAIELAATNAKASAIAESKAFTTEVVDLLDQSYKARYDGRMNIIEEDINNTEQHISDLSADVNQRFVVFENAIKEDVKYELEVAGGKIATDTTEKINAFKTEVEQEIVEVEQKIAEVEQEIADLQTTDEVINGRIDTLNSDLDLTNLQVTANTNELTRIAQVQVDEHAQFAQDINDLQEQVTANKAACDAREDALEGKIDARVVNAIAIGQAVKDADKNAGNYVIPVTLSRAASDLTDYIKLPKGIENITSAVENQDIIITIKLTDDTTKTITIPLSDIINDINTLGEIKASKSIVEEITNSLASRVNTLETWKTITFTDEAVDAINSGITKASVNKYNSYEADLADFETKLETVDGKLDTKVDKVSGKGLSTNDYTDSDKELVAKISVLEQKIETLTKDFEDYRTATEKELADLRETIIGFHPEAGEVTTYTVIDGEEQKVFIEPEGTEPSM